MNWALFLIGIFCTMWVRNTGTCFYQYENSRFSQKLFVTNSGFPVCQRDFFCNESALFVPGSNVMHNSRRNKFFTLIPFQKSFKNDAVSLKWLVVLIKQSTTQSLTILVMNEAKQHLFLFFLSSKLLSRLQWLENVNMNVFRSCN